MAKLSKRRLNQELRAFQELARDIVNPPLGGWAYERGSSDPYGEIHFVLDGQKYTVFDLVKRVVRPLQAQQEDTSPSLDAANLGILTNVVRSEVELDVARTRIQMRPEPQQRGDQ